MRIQVYLLFLAFLCLTSQVFALRPIVKIHISVNLDSEIDSYSNELTEQFPEYEHHALPSPSDFDVDSAHADKLAKNVANQIIAVNAKVTGDKIQKVGFRAMIQKLAIQYNLAGSARNNPDGSVSVVFQGSQAGIDQTFAQIRAGKKKSSTDNTITSSDGHVDPNLKSFTVFGWTSTTRQITTPYDLVFQLRSNGNPKDTISDSKSKDTWNTMVESTIQNSNSATAKDDLKKFKDNLDN